MLLLKADKGNVLLFEEAANELRTATSIGFPKEFRSVRHAAVRLVHGVRPGVPEPRTGGRRGHPQRPRV